MFADPQQNNIQLQLNPYQQGMPLVLLQAPTQSDVDKCGEVVMKGVATLNVERHESCIQCCNGDFSIVNYNSHLGEHKVKRFQPGCCYALCCNPIKKCFCSYTDPMVVTNQSTFIEDLEVKYVNRYHGFVSVKGIALGTVTLEDPSRCSVILCGSQPKVIIKKAGSNTTLTMKANDSCFQILTERLFGCFIQNKDMYIEGGSQQLKGKYSRNFSQACVNHFTGSIHFFNRLNLEFYQSIKHDTDKVLLYAAFIFLQENTNTCYSSCLCCCFCCLI